MTDAATYHRGQRNFGTGYDMIDQIEALEAKLAKAVEAAEEMSAAFYSDGNVTERHLRACKAGVKLDATLAEIKGENHD